MPRDTRRRESILSAAARAFGERGFASTSMDDVAAAAGISRLIVYRHFSSKEALYVAILERVSLRLGAVFAREVALPERASDSPRVPGRAAVVALVRVAREDPDGFTLLFRHSAREPQFAAHAEKFRRAVVRFVQGLMARVDLGNKASTRWAAETLVTYVVGAVLHWLEVGPASGSGDEMIIERISQSLPAIIRAWAEVADVDESAELAAVDDAVAEEL